MPDTMDSLICEEDLSCVVSASGAHDPMRRPGDDPGSPAACMAFDSEPAPKHAAAARSPLRPQLFVTVLEAGEEGLLVRWVESGRCHYGEQRWRLRVALMPGRCAISGRPIEPGEPVFRPVRRPVPANGDEMICPASVPGLGGAARAGVPEPDHDATDPADVAG
ncbi:DUF3331 domain-containing protein [Burkholderia sp. Bp9017]|uniref:DUF3331 domain-containing protein n=1 Tax=Burkholderia TaxID=32008 RepID=UPI000F5D877E|nr:MULTISPECIES: DUF3331 domain-containing protein [Burkholderia]RQZ31458.1 DUF3331 domain-containing protein [Burkholderia sp. Bp9017]RQZ37591.1 DUF3331 domain-containing protein [Burkholderia sp. Bp9016]